MNKIQLLEKVITGAGQQVKISEELDRGFSRLTGIAFLDNIGQKCLLVTSAVESVELFPKNFEVDFLQSNVFVPPDERFFTLMGQEAKGNRIDLEFKDGGAAPTYPYTLKVYLKLEND